MAPRGIDLARALRGLERAGNRLPHPTVLFVYLCLVMVLVSALGAAVGLQAEHPVSGDIVKAVSLLSRDGLQWILANTVSNFTSFAPVGTVLVAMLGLGIAEHSGLLTIALRSAVLNTPGQLLTFVVVLLGVLSSLTADAGYVVLVPLAGIMFATAGRNPVAGIVAAFAGVSGGFSANLLIGPLDVVLAGLSTEAAQLVQEDYTVSPAANYYFIVVSTFLISVVGTLVTEKLVAPKLPHVDAGAQVTEALSPQERRGLRWVGWFTLVFVAVLLAGLIPEQGWLRHPETGSIVGLPFSPFIQGIVTLIALYAGLAGMVFGRLSGRYRKGDNVAAMEKSMATRAGYIVMIFFAAQFVNYFAQSNLGIIAAIKGTALLQALNPGAATLLVSFIAITALVNLLIGSASAKWALIAPVFVPMLLLSGISPEATQVAYRIGDSGTNIITPLNPYLALVVAFAQRYDKTTGIGTIIVAMVPYAIAFLVCWALLLVVWIGLGWPLGPGAPVML